MPEGHTVHRLARLQRRRFAGSPVSVSSPQGRFATDAELVDGRVLESTDAHGKHLFHHYGPDPVVHVHLGLYGRFGSRTLPAAEPRGQVRMRMVAAPTTRPCAGRRRASCSSTPRSTPCTPASVRIRCLPTRIRIAPMPASPGPGPPLAALLMDQKVIAGVGNVFRAAALFRTGLDPHLPGRELGRERWERLWADLAAMLRDGERRRPCLVCATPIACETHLARNLFWCPRCQAA
jgi:endonuclease-8